MFKQCVVVLGTQQISLHHIEAYAVLGQLVREGLH